MGILSFVPSPPFDPEFRVKSAETRDLNSKKSLVFTIQNPANEVGGKCEKERWRKNLIRAREGKGK